MLPPPEGVCDAELPLFIELERGLGLDVFALLIGVEPLIGVMLPGLLGVVMLALEALPLPLPPLLPRGTKSVAGTAEDDEPDDFPVVSSRGAGIEVPWLLGRPPITPMLDSALPPAYDGLLLQQLHPVKKMPRLHAPIRPAKGILPIVISSPV